MPSCSPGRVPAGSSAMPTCGGCKRRALRSRSWADAAPPLSHASPERAARVPEPVVRRTPLRGAVQLDRLHATFMRMNASGVIFVAALNGSALGLGAEFAWACDLRVMADGEFFIGQPEILLGINPGGGGTQRLTRLIGTHRSLVAILEGKPFTPAQALANGAVDEVVAPDDVVARATELAEHFGKRTKGAVAAVKRSVYFGGSMSLSEGLARRAHRIPPNRSVRCRSETDARLPRDHGGHRRTTPLPPDTYAQALESGRVPQARLDQRGGEPVMSTAQPLPVTTSRSPPARTPVPHGFTCPPESPRRPWSSSGTASAPPARCAWTPSPSGSHRPVSPPWPSPIGTSATAAANPASSCRSSDSSPTGMPPSRWVKTRRDVDGTRIAVWGSSFGGGHAITVASRHPELKAAVAQCPFTDGLASALALGPSESLKVLPTVAKDFASMIGRRAPTMIPLAGPPGSLALMNAPDALPGYQALLPPDTTFRNEVSGAGRSDHHGLPARARGEEDQIPNPVLRQQHRQRHATGPNPAIRAHRTTGRDQTVRRRPFRLLPRRRLRSAGTRPGRVSHPPPPPGPPSGQPTPRRTTHNY